MFDNLKRIVSVREAPLDITTILLDTPQHTPDMWQLEERGFNWVFVCDECQVGHRKSELVQAGASGMTPFFPGYTSDKMQFLIKRLEKASFPIPFKNLSEITRELPVWMLEQQRIKGELYALRGCTIKTLDDYKLNGVQFDRIRMNINVPYYKRFVTRSQNYDGKWWSSDYTRSKDHIITISAFMYVARPEYWLDQLQDQNGCFNFDPVKTWSVDRVWMKEYFEYRRFV